MHKLEKRFKQLSIGNILFVLLLIAACDFMDNPFLEDLPQDSLQNATPETHLFLNFAPLSIDTIISDTSADTTFIYSHYLPDTTTSQQILFWWGEDPDGEVVSYQYRWSFQDDWTSTEAESDTFFLPLELNYKEFVFEISAIDNQGSVDPTPATLRIPVANSAPEIEFSINSNPTSGDDPNVTHVTFPTRTFAWSVSDLDGLETINHIRYRLDESSNWKYLEGSISSVTLTDIDPGYHTFYVQAVDTAGSASNLLQFPDSNDVYTPNKWLVREPQGNFLIVDDYVNDNGTAHAFYTGILDSLYGPDSYTVFEIGDDEKALPSSQTDQVAMYSFFETVIWYHFTKAPNLDDADLSLRNYLENGGNIFVSSLYINPEYTFISMDSSFNFTTDNFVGANFAIQMMDPFASDPDAVLPDTLVSEKSIPYPLFAFYPKTNLEPGESSRDLFRLTEPRANFAESWTGYPPVAQLYKPTPSAGQCVFFSLPFHKFAANNNTTHVMNIILNQVFE
ncbi:MAG: hypothetical protein K9N35_04525 [Candidatus Marinimicrobia bacterium]|nr:hypothetical protein [Candidatus Neomarinimicrobiota bacterium]